MYRKIGLSLLAGLFTVLPAMAADDHHGTWAYPLERLQLDWMRQDARRLDVSACFVRTDSFELEQQMVRKVLDEVKSRNAPPATVEACARELASLAEAHTAGADPAWQRLYFQLCETRRKLRLQIVSRFAERYIYAKHCQLANQPSFASTAFLSDSVYKDRLGDWKMGAELCLLTVAADGQVTSETLLRQPEGIIRDPCVSFAGTQIAFSMRTSEHTDDYHLYVLHWPERSVQQITFGPGTADVEPCWLPEGDIIFASTRCDISVPCWSSDATNLYRCDGQGRYLRRLGYDQAHTLYPQILHDGRIVYTRWEYNDRVSGKVHKLFVMNPDGTAQTELYGNNSHAPRSIIHARPIPGSQRVLVIGSGHHTDQSGKLMRLDRSKGTQEAEGLEYVAPVRPFVPNRDDFFGQEGELFQYPLPLDEDNYLVSFNPEGGPPRGAYKTRFGIYWMNSAGDRELLVYDPAVSCGQQVPLASRTPPRPRPDIVNFDRDEGTFYLQNVYFGAGLQGVPQGAAKKLRIVALSYRAMSAGVDYNQPSSQVHTPVSIGNGSWDVKHVLGTVDVAPDGSACFTVPARRAVYFQLLDEKGYVIQTMRSWTTLMPGETFACLGCHENKHDALSDSKLSSLALRRPPQRPVPFYQAGEVAPQEQLQFLSPAQRRAYEYLNVNAPQGMDVPQGFSYLREIQPIWDAHCVGCHTGRQQADGSAAPLSLLADTKNYGWKEAWEGVVSRPKTAEYVYPQTGKDMNPGRDYCESYVNLTKYGRVCYEQVNDLVNWLPMATSQPPMIPPYSFGSSKSRLMQYLEPAHYGVTLAQRDKDRVACWIDLNVPYCGSYMEANKWDTIVHTYIHSYRDQCRGAYLFQEAKRLRHAEIELAHLDLYREHVQRGADAALETFPRFDLGGMDAQRQFVEAYNQLPNTVPIYSLAEGKDARGGSNVKGNEVRNLALNPHAATFQLRSYPHVTSNSHFKYLPEFSPSSVIDGNASAGEETPQVPYWRPNRRTDLWLKIEFGRTVETSRVVLYLRTMPDQEKTWSSATLEFSNGHKLPIALKNTAAAQEFVFPNQLTAWVKLTDLQETFPLGDNGVTELEVFGKDVE